MDFIFLAKRVIGRRPNTVVRFSNGFDNHFIDRREEQKVPTLAVCSTYRESVQKGSLQQISNDFQQVYSNIVCAFLVRTGRLSVLSPD